MIEPNYRDARPIYQQIKENLRNMIITGEMAVGEKLPSVRELAVKLAINPNTIARAYRELEAEGCIYTVAGKGTFAAENVHARQVRLRELLNVLEETVLALRGLGMSEEELCQRIKGKRGEMHD